MEIDIIDLTDPEYSDLSPEGLELVHKAQRKKNEILKKVDEDIEEMFESLIDRHFERTTEFRQYKLFLNKKAEEEIEILKEDLVFDLAYKVKPSDSGSEEGGGGSEGGGESGDTYRYPDNPDYSLGYSDRYQVVRKYYMNATSDPNVRLRAYSNDTLAKEYLGEFYQTLYDLLASYC